MIIPKIQFVYSWIYDKTWKNFKWKHKPKVYPKEDRVLKYLKSLEKEWRKKEKKIFEELSNVTGLKWKDKIINCYVVGKCRAFSDPLTISAYKTVEDGIDVLTHELIHNLFVQGDNLEISKNSWKYFERKYKSKEKSTITHLVLHAIHKHIYLKFFNKKRLMRDIKFCSKDAEHREAWDIVESIGHENIINEFKNKTK